MGRSFRDSFARRTFGGAPRQRIFTFTKSTRLFVSILFILISVRFLFGPSLPGSSQKRQRASAQALAAGIPSGHAATHSTVPDNKPSPVPSPDQSGAGALGSAWPLRAGQQAHAEATAQGDSRAGGEARPEPGWRQSARFGADGAGGSEGGEADGAGRLAASQGTGVTKRWLHNSGRRAKSAEDAEGGEAENLREEIEKRMAQRSRDAERPGVGLAVRLPQESELRKASSERADGAGVRPRGGGSEGEEADGAGQLAVSQGTGVTKRWLHNSGRRAEDEEDGEGGEAEKLSHGTGVTKRWHHNSERAEDEKDAEDGEAEKLREEIEKRMAQRATDAERPGVGLGRVRLPQEFELRKASSERRADATRGRSSGDELPDGAAGAGDEVHSHSSGLPRGGERGKETRGANGDSAVDRGVANRPSQEEHPGSRSRPAGGLGVSQGVLGSGTVGGADKTDADDAGNEQSQREDLKTPDAEWEDASWDGGMSPDERVRLILQMEGERKKRLERLGLRTAPTTKPLVEGNGKRAAKPAAPAPPRRRGDGVRMKRLGLSGKRHPVLPAHCAPWKGWKPGGDYEDGAVVWDKAAERWEVADKQLLEACGNTQVERAGRVVEAMRHAWDGYASNAWGHDEVLPVSGGYKDWVAGGMGLTLIDSMDTLWLMGLKQEFSDAASWVDQEFDPVKKADISVFETTIRVIGGLLSAYTLSVDDALLQKARATADALLPAFDQFPTGIPASLYNPETGAAKFYPWARNRSLLAEIGTLQLEWRYLAWLTGDSTYDRVVTKASDHFHATPKPNGHLDGISPLFVNPRTGAFASSLYSLGGMGDSYYEYLLKQWLQTGRLEPAAPKDPEEPARRVDAGATYRQYKHLWGQARAGIRSHLIGKSGRWTYIAPRVSGVLTHRMDHLSCFYPGMLALGHMSGDGGSGSLELAKELMDTCVAMYTKFPTGLPPEEVLFVDDEMVASSRFFLLRPEAVESLFYLWRATKDQRYRDIGWDIFRSIETRCRAPFGYASIESVTELPAAQRNSMESFFPGETLKYLFLLFADDSLLPLDKFVLNTEAHVLPVVPKPMPSMSVHQDSFRDDDWKAP
ncbi:Mannosyl-oligosaccharide 1 [Diplonema papillatum]|nr:Mannosyl-oligosaccharide 1 [Diplonema papillatum]